MNLEAILRRDRAVVLVALAAITVLAWAYVIQLAGQMEMGGMDMTGFRMASAALQMVMKPNAQPWTMAELAFTFVMWVVMMIGMMLPSAAPMVLLYARVARQSGSAAKPFAPMGFFLAGYLAAWTGFSLAATLAQWLLDRAAWLSPTMGSASALLAGLLLIGAGAYQWTSLKYRCLEHCQSPIHFLQRHGGFRRDAPGSFGLGFRHGSYCVGCCWVLMGLLFVGGVMNLLWIAGIAILVLAEKLIPTGRQIPRIAGLGLAAAGVWVLASGLSLG